MTAALPDFGSAGAGNYPAAIFGKLPAGFVLKDQQIRMLVYWHRKAMKAVDDLPAGSTDADMAAAMAPVNELLDVIKAFVAKRPNEIAAQMRAILEWMDFSAEHCIEVELSTADFRNITRCLTAATEPLRPKKKTGALQRGRLLTRFGLIHRYQAFLIQELETIGWHVYGERDYPMGHRPVDDAVNKRCSTPNARGQYPVFFSPETLPDRARAVLKSLRVDTVRGEERPRRKSRSVVAR
jgi:hypothetical protein